MNRGTVTGGVVKAAVSAYTVPTFEAPSIRRVVFSIATTDSHGEKSFWNCEAEGDPVTLDLIEHQAHPGAGIRLEFELATRPFYKRAGGKEVHVGEVRFLRVIKAEFPPRHAPVGEPVEAGA